MVFIFRVVNILLKKNELQRINERAGSLKIKNPIFVLIPY